MHEVIQRIQAPNGAIYKRGGPFPKFEETDENTPFVITEITVAPKTQDDVGGEDGTSIEEVEASIELWSGPRAGDDETTKKVVEDGWVYCLRIYLGAQKDLVSLEIWPLDEAIAMIEARQNKDESGLAEETPVNGVQPVVAGG